MQRARSIEEWKENVETIKYKIISSSQDNGKVKYIILGLYILLAATCYFLDWRLLFKVIGILIFLQVISIVKLLYRKVKNYFLK